MLVSFCQFDTAKVTWGKGTSADELSHQIGLLACTLGSFPLLGMFSLLLGEPVRQLLVTAEMGVPLLHH